MEAGRAQPRTREGVVVSDRMEKSAVIVVRRRIQHRRYRKFIHVSKKYLIHDENNECVVGDLVLISETRPMSKRKRWRLRRVLKKAAAEVETIDEVKGAGPDEPVSAASAERAVEPAGALAPAAADGAVEPSEDPRTAG